ncbi:MAG: dTDP-4-dehydrorhamnose reductase [Mucispirillum sp.]|nr:dTDP-4-dehydrorhamnose reductase [Mucispirillum sp.]
MKVLVTGVKGQLGFDVCKELDKRNIENKGIDRDDCDITDEQAVLSYIKNYAPDVVVHCAAYTAVDRAEDEKEICYNVNVKGTEYIACACKEIDAKMVYISTDYVFEGVGDAAYEVDDKTSPDNTYGITKYQGEEVVRNIVDKYFIIRISWAFGINGSNFINTMMKLGETHRELNVVADQIGSPTFTYDLAPLICDMIATDTYGIYHATNEGYCSWADLAEYIFSVTGQNVLVHHIKSEEYPTKASRPKNSRLSKASLDKAGFKRLPDWQDAVKRYINEKLGR